MEGVAQFTTSAKRGYFCASQTGCGLAPDEPRLIEHYLAEGRYLACCTSTSSWTIAVRSFRLVLDTATDMPLRGQWGMKLFDGT